MERFLSLRQAAKLLGISHVALFKQIQAGKVKAAKVGKVYVIDRDDLTLISEKTVSEKQKQDIDEGIEKTIEEYGETLRLLKDT